MNIFETIQDLTEAHLRVGEMVFVLESAVSVDEVSVYEIRDTGDVALQIANGNYANFLATFQDLPADWQSIIDLHNNNPSAHPELLAAVDAAVLRAEAAADLAASNVNLFDDITAGLAGTIDGEYFSVVNPDGSVTIYKNVGGVAVEQNTVPSSNSLNATVQVRDDYATMLTLSPTEDTCFQIRGNLAKGDQAGRMYVALSTDPKGNSDQFANGRYAVPVDARPNLTVGSSLADAPPAQAQEGDFHVIVTDEVLPNEPQGFILASASGTNQIGSSNPADGLSSLAASGSVQVLSGVTYRLKISANFATLPIPSGVLQVFEAYLTSAIDGVDELLAATLTGWRDGAIYKAQSGDPTAHYRSFELSGMVTYTATSTGALSFRMDCNSACKIHDYCVEVIS